VLDTRCLILDVRYTLYETKSLKETETYKSLCEEYDHLGKMITNFIKSVEHGHKTKAKIPPGQTIIWNRVSRNKYLLRLL